MTAESIRKAVGHLQWVDDLAWMESMGNSGWKKFCNAEANHWASISKKSKIQDIARFFAQRIQAQMSAGASQLFSPPHRELWIGMRGTMALSWAWAKKEMLMDARKEDFVADLDSRIGGHLWTVQDIGEGAESYELCYRTREYGIHWSHRGVGPFVAVVGARVYTLEARHSLVYWRLVSWNAYTGKDRRIHYEEKDSSVNLALLRATPISAFLLREAGGFQQLFRISAAAVAVSKTKGLLQLSKDLSTLRKHILGDSGTSWFQWENSAWEPKGEWTRYKLPPLKQWNPEQFSIAREILICASYGERSLWKVFRTKPPVCIWRGLGDIQLDPWGGPMARVILPGALTQWWDMDRMGTSLFTPKPPAMCLEIAKRYVTRSADGTNVPYIIVQSGEKGRTKGLLIVGYSAYGISTGLGTGRWVPLLERGWAICIAMFRGSGDASPAWAEAGRRSGRVRVLEDAVAVIRAARGRVGCSAAQTILYGRSAGGLWVGGCAASFPRGDLFGGIYMEVPYLDVLRTTSNPSLPLTEIETKEFGRADLSIVDFEGMLRWSPMELLGEEGAPNLFQLVRTGVNDQEVLAYEPAKWILRSRGPLARSSSPAFFVMEDHQGHFSSGWRGIEQNALDAAVLDAWVE